jgi:hypothetical protein
VRLRLSRGLFRSAAELEAAIARYVEVHNAKANPPFVWTATADSGLAKVERGAYNIVQKR